jgi:type II secretory pathway pseudopilin PulG
MSALVRRNRRGFSLVEVAVVGLIVIVLLALIVPRALNSYERDKAADAFQYLSAVHDAQAKYRIRLGMFADDVHRLEVPVPPPEDFNIGNPGPGDTQRLEDSWSLTLTRKGMGLHRGYKVIFTEKGFDPSRSDLPESIKPPQK